MQFRNAKPFGWPVNLKVGFVDLPWLIVLGLHKGVLGSFTNAFV